LNNEEVCVKLHRKYDGRLLPALFYYGIPCQIREINHENEGIRLH